MKELEALAVGHPALALRLMVFLYDVADAVIAADVCDGVEFWISESKDPTLARFLERKIERFPGRPSSVAALAWLRWLRSSDAALHGGGRHG
ncbi:MAG TPA: hypothetical protein VF331_23285 [Polyangiales bacterium]